MRTGDIEDKFIPQYISQPWAQRAQRQQSNLITHPGPNCPGPNCPPLKNGQLGPGQLGPGPNCPGSNCPGPSCPGPDSPGPNLPRIVRLPAHLCKHFSAHCGKKQNLQCSLKICDISRKWCRPQSQCKLFHLVSPKQNIHLHKYSTGTFFYLRFTFPEAERY